MNDSQLLEEVREVVRLVAAANGEPEPILLDEEIRAALEEPESLTEGRWITIGAKDDEGGRKGGSHVYIDGGRITKGHPSLVGKKIGAMKDEPEPQSHRSALHQEKGYSKAVWAKKARQHGIEPNDLHQLAAEIKAHDQAYVDDHNAMLRDARKASQEKGFTNVTNLRARNAVGKVDAAALKGFDDVADQMAKKYPHLLGNPDEASDKLFDLLTSGNRQAMSYEDAYQQAFDHLASEPRNRTPKPRKAKPVDTDFDFGMNVKEQQGDVAGDTPEERYKQADYIELPDDIPGTKCGNCQFLGPVDNYCKKLRATVKERGCCDFWDRPGTKRTNRRATTEAVIACKPQVPLPDVRQEFGFDCGAAALRSVLDYFGLPPHPDTEPEMIKELGSSPRDGTSPDKIVHMAVRCGLTVYASGSMTLDDLRACLERKQPVICPVQMFWHPKAGKDAIDGDEDGHWIVVAGIDDNAICIQDPVFGKVFLEPIEFLRAWHDRDGEGREYRRWGVALGKS